MESRPKVDTPRSRQVKASLRDPSKRKGGKKIPARKRREIILERALEKGMWTMTCRGLAKEFDVSYQQANDDMSFVAGIMVEFHNQPTQVQNNYMEFYRSASKFVSDTLDDVNASKKDKTAAANLGHKLAESDARFRETWKLKEKVADKIDVNLQETIKQDMEGWYGVNINDLS